MRIENVWTAYIKDHIGLSIAIAVGVIMVLTGVIDYIRTYIGESKGATSFAKNNTITMPPRRKKKKEHLLPAPLFWGGVLLSVTPILLRLADLRYGFQLSKHLPLEKVPDILLTEKTEYYLLMLIFMIGAIVATALLFTAFYRVCRKGGWGFIKTILVWLFTYNLGTRLVYNLCVAMSKHIFDTADGAAMMYAWVIYVYILLWEFFYRLLKN